MIKYFMKKLEENGEITEDEIVKYYTQNFITYEKVVEYLESNFMLYKIYNANNVCTYVNYSAIIDKKDINV